MSSIRCFLRVLSLPVILAPILLFAQAETAHWSVVQAQHDQRIGALEREMAEFRALRQDVSTIKADVAEIRATVKAAHSSGLDASTIIVALLSLLLGGGAGVAAPKLRNGLRGV